MIRYSSYGATNFRPPIAPTDLDPLKAEYQALLELRERVKAAEQAAQLRAMRPSLECPPFSQRTSPARSSWLAGRERQVEVQT